jgi:prepilin-type N-terminal cleavage/methylation domain-containing protein
MKSKSGFTLIELIVVIAILGVLTVVAAFNYTGVQRQTRDTQRSSSATLIAESLEKYFTKNGEYPSVAKVTSTDGNSVKTLLDLSNTDSLLAPFATAGTTNSWKAGTASKTNPLTYNGNTDSTSSCSTGSGATDACRDFRIQYYDEQTDTIATIVSRHTSQAIDTTTVTGIAAPSAPTVTSALSGANVVATATAVTCEQGTTPQYAFRSRTNNGSWSAYGSWITTRTSSAVATQGTLFGFQAKAKCDSDGGTNASADSSASTETTYTHPINTPAALNPYTTASYRPNYNGNLCIDAAGGGNTNGTPIQVYVCNGTAAQDWAYNSNDRTIRPTYNMNLCVTNQGAGMQLVLWACDGHVARQWNYDVQGYLVSVSNGQCMDAANWGGSGTPINVWGCNNATAQIWYPSDSQTAWRWAATSCPAGTTVEYRANNQTTALSDSGWFSTGATNYTIRTTVNQGFTYTTQVQSRCYNSYATSSWSGVSQASVNKAVLRPGNAYNWSFYMLANRSQWGWYFASPACGAATDRSYLEDTWIGTNNNAGGGILYWLAPRTPNGPGHVWWWYEQASGGVTQLWYDVDSNGNGSTGVTYPGSAPAGVNVTARAQYRCVNWTTGRAAYGDWYQTSFSNT